MKNSLLKGVFVFLTLISVSIAHSQKVTGKVSDSTGPIPGASVTVKGTTNSTQTDFDGNYTIQNVASDAVLVFSYIGLKTQELSVAGKSTLNVVLKTDQQELTEVVVIGYGTVKKKDATGAVDVLGSKKFDNISATSPAELLRGKVSGVQVTSSSGEPGASTAIRIRGNSSVRSGNEPLIVIDGVPLSGGSISSGGAEIDGLGSSSARNPLNFINQNDIESISILKDASSTAIYGSRGANGVIMITTKKGKSKEPQLTYSTSVQFSSLKTKFELLDANSYVAAGGIDKGSRSYNWKDALLQNGFSNSHDVSYSSGTDNSSTRVSFGLNSTDGIVKNTGIDKYTGSFANTNDFFGGRLRIDSKILYTALKDKTTLISNNAGYIGNVIGSAMYWNPTLPTRNADGTYYSFSNNGPQGPNDDDYINPEQALDSYKDFTNTSKIIASINSTLKITSNLKYQFLFGVENSNSTRKRQFSPTFHVKSNTLVANDPDNGGVKKYGYANISDANKFNKTFEHTLNYTKEISSNFDLDAVVGYSYYDYNADGHEASGTGYNPAQTDLIDNIEGGIASKFRTTSYRNRVELQSFFGRANVTLYKKLIATATVRRDGSTKLGTNKKYDVFPSVGLAYKVLEDKEGLINSFKIRANYGKTGNAEFAANSALARGFYNFGGSLTSDSGRNDLLIWETTKSYGVGTDFVLLKNKLTGSLDYFNRDTKDLIAPLPAAASQPGPPTPKTLNLKNGNLINTGYEVALNYNIINKENLTWDFSINSAFLKNKMKNFGSNVFIAGGLNGQGLSGAYSEVIKDNYPIYTYYLYEFLGYAADGSSLYKGSDGSATDLGHADKKYLDKQALPKINLGFSTSATYKNLDVSVSFYGAFGHYLYNNTANAYFFKSALNGGRNVTPEVANSQQNGADPNSPSTKYLEKGDFLRMGNLTFGYTFKGAFLDQAHIKAARFYVNGQNLLLFTKYKGFDPEVDTDKTLNGVPSAGIDYLSYPRAKSFSFGLNVTF